MDDKQQEFKKDDSSNVGLSSASEAEFIIKIENVVKSYKVKDQVVVALNDLSLEIREGEFVVLNGPSGSGKSTLLQLLGGLDRPTSGNIMVDNINTSKLSDRMLSEFRARTIGFVFQSFYLQPFLRLAKNVEVPGMFAHLNRRERKKRVQELADLVGLSDRLQHFPKELSGGQIQRAAIIRALINQPKIILADEPTGNLDSQNGMAIIELLEDIRNKLGTTIIVATHDPVIAGRADRVITMKDGAIV